jgi:hypothetical protein
MAYDPKCQELAEYFLSSPHGMDQISVRNLAQAIQDAVEMELGYDDDAAKADM